MTMTPTSMAVPRGPGAHQKGLSLIELMVGMVIGLALLAALGGLYVSTSKARTEFDKTGTQVENGRYAVETMVRDIEMAGFYGRPGTPATATFNLPTVCATAKTAMGFSTTSGLTVPVGVSGLATNATAPSASCLSSIGTSSEALTVRYASSVPVSASSASGTEYYVQMSTCSTDAQPLVYDSSSANLILMTKTCSSGTLAELRKFVVRTYYVASCDSCATNIDTIPTLKVAEFVNGSIQVSSLVDGIQDVHFSYGVDTDNNGSPDCYVDNPAINNATSCTGSAGYDWSNATTNWSNVTSVRVTVLARNLVPTNGWTDTKTYNLGRATADGPYKDAYKRHVYSAVARVWNVGGLRESQ